MWARAPIGSSLARSEERRRSWKYSGHEGRGGQHEQVSFAGDGWWWWVMVVMNG